MDEAPPDCGPPNANSTVDETLFGTKKKAPVNQEAKNKQNLPLQEKI